MGPLVVLDELVLQLFHLHEPRRDSHVQKRRPGAVAVRVRVHVRVLVDHGPLVLQLLHDRLVGVLRKLPLKIGHRLVEVPRQAERIHEGQSVILTDLEVVLAERRRLVNDAGAARGFDVIRRHDEEGRTLAVHFLGVLLEVGKQRPIAAPDESRALQSLEFLGLADSLACLVVAEPTGLHVRDLTRLRHADLHVLDVRVDGQRQVRRQRPRGRRPRPQVRLFILQLEPHREARVLPTLMPVLLRDGVALLGAEGHLEVRERRAERGRHRLHAVALVDAAIFPELGEDPPHRLHEVRVHRAIAAIVVDPAAEPTDRPAPLLGVAHHDPAARLVELLDPKLVDVGLRHEAEVLLGLVLHGQTVAVPAPAPLDALALHRPVARNDVLQDRGYEVPVVGLAGRERGTVVEDVGLRLGPLLDAPLERVRRIPGVENSSL